MQARSLDQNCDVFRVERMTVASAIFSPQMVVVQLDSRRTIAGSFHGKSLPVNGAVLRLDFGSQLVGLELGREGRAIMTPNHESWHELEQQLLLECVTQAVVICIGERFPCSGWRRRPKYQKEKNPSQKNCRFESPGVPRVPHAFSLYARIFVPASGGEDATRARLSEAARFSCSLVLLVRASLISRLPDGARRRADGLFVRRRFKARRLGR